MKFTSQQRNLLKKNNLGRGTRLQQRLLMRETIKGAQEKNT